MSLYEKNRSKLLPRALRESLALCTERPQSVLFLDIETTGLSHYYDEITIVGWSLGRQCRTYVKGDEGGLPADIFRDANVMVTFNGIRFDQKFLEREFPEVKLPPVHIDLMYLARRAGLTGGQKAIERDLGIDIREKVQSIDGFAAVLLWHRYLRGDLDALKELIIYNRSDIAGMGAIMDDVLARLPVEYDLLTNETCFRDWAAPDGWLDINRKIRPPDPGLKPAHTFDRLFSGTPAASSRIVGIDLSGSEARASGWCLLDGKRADTALLKLDDEILARTIQARPDLVSVDSPLCLPFGRESVFDDDPGRDKYGIMRECERELKRRGVNVYPSLLPSMQRLTARGIVIAKQLREQGIPVIESYPGAAQDIMRIPRKGAGLAWLRQGLSEFGLTGQFTKDDVSHDELDAITSAIVGTFHLAAMTEELGTAHEPPLIIPDLSAATRPIVVGLSGPIAAGKTTLAKSLERRGFAYTRFSKVIDDLLIEQGLKRNRRNRQELGDRIQREGRQRELARKTLDAAGAADRIVVDGLRFPDDHAYLFEKFGFHYLHLFVDAPVEVRKQRFEGRASEQRASDETSFEEASASSVEAGVGAMQRLAWKTVHNDGGREDAERAMMCTIEQYFEAQRCLSQS